jgi:hypothetical protein
MHGVERRQAPRLKLVGAHVIYRLNKGRYSLKWLYDITKTSARFEVDHEMELGDILELVIIVPKNEYIHLKGSIIRLSDPASQDAPYVVVQFLPFEGNEQSNSKESYQQLSKLIDSYLLSEKLAAKIPVTWRSD